MSEEPSLPELDLQLVDRYLAGESTPEERAFVERRLAERPVDVRVVATVRAHAAQSLRRDDDPIVDPAALAALLRLQGERKQDGHRTTVRGNFETPAVVSKRRFSGIGTLQRAFLGGVAILLAVVGVIGYRLTRAEVSFQHYRTTLGQQSTIRLADGSTMILAPATSVTVSPISADVVGEVYFTIASRAARPFTVRTGNAAVRVLGTAFVVRHYTDESNTRVVVEDGKVAVLPRSNESTNVAPAVVTPHMLAQITDSGVTVQRGISGGDYIAWTQGRLIFDTTVLRDVVRELSRAYGVEIRVADSAVTQRKMTFAVSVREDSITDVLRRIALAVDAHVARQGSAFVIVAGRLPVDTPQVKHFPQPEKQYGR